MQVCIVEDDVRLAGLLQQALEEDGSVTTHLPDSEEAASYIAGHAFDTVVLDLMLPGADGYSVLTRLRSARCQTPVLVVSARDTVSDMVRALDAGADDYMTKPFHLDLFLARVRSVSRRGAIPQAITLAAGPVTMHPGSRKVQLQGQPLALTRREYMLLETLMRRAGQVLSRDQLAQAVWGYDADVSKGNLDFHVHSLRSKLGPACAGLVSTVRGIGYVFQAEAAHT